MNKGTFFAGWQGVKICQDCKKDFFSQSGARRFCNDCILQKIICLECGGEKSLYHKFCGGACASKYNQRNNPKVRTININRLSLQRGISISRALMGRARLDMRGEKNHNWSGGTYRNERHTLMGRVEYLEWRRAVYKRDDYTCQICKIKGKRLNADHIIPYIADKSKVLDINNGRTLCVECHRKTDTYGTRAKKFILAIA